MGRYERDGSGQYLRDLGGGIETGNGLHVLPPVRLNAVTFDGARILS